jgi:hypothetical protein
VNKAPDSEECDHAKGKYHFRSSLTKVGVRPRVKHLRSEE